MLIVGVIFIVFFLVVSLCISHHVEFFQTLHIVGQVVQKYAMELIILINYFVVYFIVIIIIIILLI